jgi:hypothetical protein
MLAKCIFVYRLEVVVTSPGGCFPFDREPALLNRIDQKCMITYAGAFMLGVLLHPMFSHMPSPDSDAFNGS